MTLRVKFLCVSLLLCVALTCMFLSAAGTIQAYQQLQKNHQHILSGDVNSVNYWMTVPYISRIYHVPENCLAQSLHISDSWQIHHATLRVIADYSGRPINTVLLDVRNAILAYRKHHVTCSDPAPPKTTSHLSVLHLPLFTLWRGECQ